MKHKLLKLILLWMLTGLLPSSLHAVDFKYTYEGQTITYTILDEAAKTVEANRGIYLEGSLILPETVYYNNEPYTLTTVGDYAFSVCIGLTSVTLPNSLTALGDYAFSYCSGLTSVTLPNSITEIGGSAFFGCIGLTHDVYNNKIFAYAARVPNRTMVEIPNGIEIIAGSAFRDFSDLKSVTLPNSVTTIEDYAFGGCSGLTSVTLPNSLTEIGNWAFSGCSGLTGVTLPNSVTTFGNYAFEGCIGLISYDRNATQTTIYGEVKKADSKSNFEAAAYMNETIATSKYLFANLNPGKKYPIDYGFKYKEYFYTITTESVTTASVDLNLYVSNKTSTSAVLLPTINNGDAKISEEYWYGIDGKPSGNVEIAGLNPNEDYTFKYVLQGESGWTVSNSVTVKTKELELKTQPGQAMNTKTALLSAKTNISELEENVGFEWRRYDAPETLPSQKVMCAVVDGVLMGALSNLNPDVYYNYRPFYTSNSGKTYYGDWVTVFTGDANVYFDPTVRTYTTTNVGETGATIRGYALRGSDDIKRQGFQYWSEATSRAANGNVTEVEVSGTRLTYPLNGLKPGTTYSYRVFVETAAGTTYGDTVSFTTKGEESGIDEIEAEAAQDAVVVGYWNVQGVRSDKPYRGLNLVRYSDGTVRKEMR